MCCMLLNGVLIVQACIQLLSQVGVPTSSIIDAGRITLQMFLFFGVAIVCAWCRSLGSCGCRLRLGTRLLLPTDHATPLQYPSIHLVSVSASRVYTRKATTIRIRWNKEQPCLSKSSLINHTKSFQASPQTYVWGVYALDICLQCVNNRMVPFIMFFNKQYRYRTLPKQKHQVLTTHRLLPLSRLCLLCS